MLNGHAAWCSPPLEGQIQINDKAPIVQVFVLFFPPLQKEENQDQQKI